METRFIVDMNVGRLARWLRLLGYDALFINPVDDQTLVEKAVEENRVILTKDTAIARRRVVTSGQLRVILVEGDSVREQLRQVLRALKLDPRPGCFSRCAECNEPLVAATREEVRDIVPPYVFKTQTHYMRCPKCDRFYWQGTHWQRMTREVDSLVQ